MATMIETETAETTRETFCVPACNLPALAERLEALNKRAKRLRVPGVAIEVDDQPARVECEFVNRASAYRWLTAGLRPGGDGWQKTGRVRTWHNVTVTGERPRLPGGWRLVAVLAHVADDGGEVLEVIKSVPGESVPVAFRGRGPVCDHCRANRRRNDTFVVANDAGEFKQVGRNCLADFLGHVDPHAIAGAAEILCELRELAAGAVDDDFFGMGWGRANAWSIEYFLSMTAASIRAFGWLSRGAARENGGCATADVALLQIVNRDKIPERDRITPTDDDKRLAETAAAWAADLHVAQPAEVERSDYLHSVNVVARVGYVNHKTAGLAASIVAVYQREQQRELQKQAAAASQHFGTVGKRAEYVLTLTAIRFFESAFGTKALHSFVDAAGNVAVWWATRAGDMRVGETCRVKATVKSHDDYRGVKQTTLTRCTVIGEIE